MVSSRCVTFPHLAHTSATRPIERATLKTPNVLSPRPLLPCRPRIILVFLKQCRKAMLHRVPNSLSKLKQNICALLDSLPDPDSEET